VVNLVSVTVRKPEPVNLILGQAHFIKTVSFRPHITDGILFCWRKGQKNGAEAGPESFTCTVEVLEGL
jgi:adenosine/AMP kinase